MPCIKISLFIIQVERQLTGSQLSDRKSKLKVNGFQDRQIQSQLKF
jgi:hypothetical protein